nr:hypothetical protein [Trichoderma atroviride]
MDEVVPECLTRDSYTVGWICALDVELAASMAMLDHKLSGLPQAKGDTNTYILGRIGQHNIALTCLPLGTTGTNAAANAATNMLRSFPNIRSGLMVGIGGGAPSAPSDDPREDIRLGDVVISCPSANSGGVLQYDFGKTMSEGKFVQTGILNKTSIVLSNSVSSLRARHRTEESDIPKYIGRALVLRKARENTNPVIHYGLIGSANQVMKHGATRDKLRDEKNIICFEMEAAGIMDVFPCLIIRGICDYADSHKNKRWQPHAAVTAAACAKEVLLATPTSELHVKSFFKGEAIYNMLQATLHEMNWEQLLDLLPLRDYTRHECFEIRKSYEDPKYHWALRNIAFKKWSLNEGPRVLYLTGHPYEGNLSQLSSFVVERENAAGHLVLPLFCSNMRATTTVAAFLHILLLELAYCSLEEQRTPIIRGFFSKLLEDPDIRNNLDIQEENFNKEIFSKCMKTILESAATKDLLSLLKTAFDFERQRHLLIVINGLDVVESMDELIRCIHPLIEHLQRKQNIKILLTSSTKSKTTTPFQNSLYIEYDKERTECLQSLQFDNTRYDKISEEYEDFSTYKENLGAAKIFMASRPVAQLEARRDRFHNFIKLDDETRSDIRNYAQLRLRDIGSTDLLDQATSYMLQNAQGVFLWVKLISEQLIEAHEEGYSEQEVFELLKRLPTELEDFYGHMLEKMEHNKSSLLHATKMFRLILFARRPLTVDEILHALGISDDVDSDPKFIPSDASLEKRLPSSERVILSSGGNFLEIKQSNGQKIVQIMHQTVREFFLDPDGPVANSVFQVSEAHAHAYIAITCIRYLSYINRRPLATYALGYIKSHIDIGKQDANIENAISGLIEHLTSGSAGASLLERWGGSGLHRDTGSRSHVQDATAMTFRCEILRYSSIYGFSIAAELVLLAETDMDNQDKDGRTPLSLAAGNGYEAIVKLLLEGGAKTEIKDKNGQTPLSRAAMNGQQGNVMRLSEYGAFIDEHDISGVTPLSWAAKNNHLSIVKFLVSRRAKIEYPSHQTTLSQAVKHGHLAIVKFLVEKGAKIDPNKYQKSPLAYATEHGHLAIVKFLVEKGAKINFNGYQKSPLAYAAEHGYLAIVRFLFEKGVKIESNDSHQTPLSYAIEHALVGFLFEKGVKIESNDSHQTPLSCAIEHALVGFLFEKGVKIESNDSHQTPLSCAIEHALVGFRVEKYAKIDYMDSRQMSLSCAVKNGQLAIVEFLVEKGAKVDSNVFDKKSLLAYAAEHGHLAIARFLAEKGVKIESNDARQSPLASAAEHGHLAIVRFLVEKGAQIDCSGDYFKAPLFLAVEKGHLDIVRYLISKGANAEIKIGRGKTLVSRAVEIHRLDIVKFLIEMC